MRAKIVTRFVELAGPRAGLVELPGQRHKPMRVLMVPLWQHGYDEGVAVVFRVWGDLDERQEARVELKHDGAEYFVPLDAPFYVGTVALVPTVPDSRTHPRVVHVFASEDGRDVPDPLDEEEP